MTGVDAARAGGDPAFRSTPWPCQVLLSAWVLLAVVLPLRDGLPDAPRTVSLAGIVVALLGLAALDVELGRRAEGGRLVGQRPHKGLSAWPFAVALVSPEPLAVPLVVVPVYVLCRWRGMRVPLWKWVGSGAIAVLAGSAAQVVSPAGPPGALGDVLVPAVTFLAVSAAGFWCSALTGDRVDEAWLRSQLVRPAYYGTELAVLSQGAVLALLYAADPLLVLLVGPSFAMAQRALMHAPLRDQADRDTKTGLLNHGAWTAAAERELALPSPVGVLLLDLDHFKRVNDVHGHLVGDAALVATARAVEGAVRAVDVVGRFGGEEFCVLLPDARTAECLAVAERVRVAVAAVRLPASPDVRLSASVGVHAHPRPMAGDLSSLLTAADRALLRAKAAGRDQVVGPPLPTQRRRAARPAPADPAPEPVVLSGSAPIDPHK